MWTIQFATPDRPPSAPFQSIDWGDRPEPEMWIEEDGETFEIDEVLLVDEELKTAIVTAHPILVLTSREMRQLLTSVQEDAL